MPVVGGATGTAVLAAMVVEFATEGKTLPEEAGAVNRDEELREEEEVVTTVAAAELLVLRGAALLLLPVLEARTTVL